MKGSRESEGRVLLSCLCLTHDFVAQKTAIGIGRSKPLGGEAGNGTGGAWLVTSIHLQVSEGRRGSRNPSTYR